MSHNFKQIIETLQAWVFEAELSVQRLIEEMKENPFQTLEWRGSDLVEMSVQVELYKNVIRCLEDIESNAGEEAAIQKTKLTIVEMQKSLINDLDASTDPMRRMMTVSKLKAINKMVIGLYQMF